ncbi:sugar transferase [Adlercreutzia sp. ZJ242]|uniref:sugar transferase n=1 Tax=Adlercreutzia sp. ZJ242 TaxID=2709409 RepID=UPI0013EC95D7|nr:sugar transferase [Adlercreutzia sp. ZJ242]
MSYALQVEEQEVGLDESFAREASEQVAERPCEACREVTKRPLVYRVAKRAFDVAFSLCVLAVCLVPGVILSVAVTLDTKGSPIYSQERVGRGGKVFRIYKMRTMVADSDDVAKYLDEDQLAQWERERKVDDDPRITPLGAKLRATSLDEVPQFLNVLKGDMSVVGPRPLTTDELEQHFTPEDRALLLSVPAGITGLWQVGSRNDATFENGERQVLELGYARGVSLRLDAEVAARTLGAMFVRRTGR